jgi:N-acylneuraminate cytidylyltransferase
VPGKNLRLLGGSPLIVWSIEAAQDIPQICDILVSTDDSAIAHVARKARALVPWLRPPELATDTATSEAVCLHALDWYESEKGSVDGLLLLQPTSPFRSRDTIRRGIRLFQQQHRRLVLGISPARSHPLWCLRPDGPTVKPFVEGGGLHLRSQDLPPAFVVNGAFYLIAPEELRSSGVSYAENLVPLVIDDPAESMDLDTEWDWTIAEAIVRLRKLSSVEMRHAQAKAG